MKFQFFFVLFLSTALFLSLESKDLQAAPPNVDADWELTFEDNFDSPKLDASKWFPAYRPGRKEYYRLIGHKSRWQDELNAIYSVENGILKLRIDRELPKRATAVSPCVSSIQTAIYKYDQTKKTFQDEVKFAQKYGWFEIRSRMPAGSGLHAAFWLVQVGAFNQEYDINGKRKTLKDGLVEIDIFEQLGNETVDPAVNRFNVHFTKNSEYKFKMSFDPSEDFHVWALNWEEGRLSWYCDGKKVHVYEGPTPQNKILVLLGMYQMGETLIKGWSGPVDPNMKYPRDFEIDYLRVWQKK